MQEEIKFDNPYGLLLNDKDIKLNRRRFEEMVSLLGIQCIYKAPKKDKHYNERGEVKENFEAPILTGCIFQEHPDAKTLKKIGWVTELSSSSSLIHVPFDLPNLQVGALFIVPDTFDPSKGRVFRVASMSALMVYPASITCEIVPEWENKFEDSQLMFKNKSLTLLNDESEWEND